jgi:hypothetical protein
VSPLQLVLPRAVVPAGHAAAKTCIVPAGSDAFTHMLRPSLHVARDTNPVGQERSPLVVASHVCVAILQNCVAPHSSWRSQPALQRWVAAASHHWNAPHPFTTQSCTHVLPSGTYPALHLIAHAPASQLAAPLAVPGQGVHEVPHVSGEVEEAHAPPHSWNPALHALLHVPLSQEAVAFVRVGQLVHVVPQAVGSVSALHAAPHAWKRASHVALHMPSAQATAPFEGALQSTSVRHPSAQVRVASSQKRPLLHSSSRVQPTLHVFDARSQYDSAGQGHVAGSTGGLPSSSLPGTGGSSVGVAGRSPFAGCDAEDGEADDDEQATAPIRASAPSSSREGRVRCRRA